MFDEFKKDKITNLITKVKIDIEKEYNKHNINFLQAHCMMENEIENIYINNDFYYQDLLN